MEKRLWIVAYDISDPARLRRIAAILEDTGTRVQKSVFECFLSTHEVDALRTRLGDEMDSTADKLRCYPLCAWCVGRMVWQGRGDFPTDPDYYLI